MDMKILGERIKEVRTSREMTLEALASAVKVNKSTISRYERGEIESPKMPVIQSIASVLHVNPSWLIGKSPDKTYTPPHSSFCLFTPNNLFTPLKTLRKARGLSPEHVAFSVGISKEHYLSIERDGCNTDCITLARLANFFCCGTDFLLAFDGVLNEEEMISEITEKLFRLHHAFEPLSSENQEKVIRYAESLSTDSD